MELATLVSKVGHGGGGGGHSGDDWDTQTQFLWGHSVEVVNELPPDLILYLCRLYFKV